MEFSFLNLFKIKGLVGGWNSTLKNDYVLLSMAPYLILLRFTHVLHFTAMNFPNE